MNPATATQAEGKARNSVVAMVTVARRIEMKEFISS
jgi:hypothetical protein